MALWAGCGDGYYFWVLPIAFLAFLGAIVFYCFVVEFKLACYTCLDHFWGILILSVYSSSSVAMASGLVACEGDFASATSTGYNNRQSSCLKG